MTATIELTPGLRSGLQCLDQSSHALILTDLHQAHFDSSKHLRRRPRGLFEMPEIGIFSQRAKDRPNPIGVTAVRILSVSEASIRVQGLDAIDGTPVLDIKPYVPHFDRVEDATVPDWMERLMRGYF